MGIIRSHPRREAYIIELQVAAQNAVHTTTRIVTSHNSSRADWIAIGREVRKLNEQRLDWYEISVISTERKGN